MLFRYKHKQTFCKYTYKLRLVEVIQPKIVIYLEDPDETLSDTYWLPYPTYVKSSSGFIQVPINNHYLP